jgi:mannose-6-phosphate isomerase-like protein (cupin superfamily)
MPTLITKPARIESAGNKPKLIDEYIGRVNSRHGEVSVAHMHSPGGWIEPGQTPAFAEFTIVLKGRLRVEHHGGALDVGPGQAVIVHPGEWVRYSTPEPQGAEYIAVCLPAFSLETVHRDLPESG